MALGSIKDIYSDETKKNQEQLAQIEGNKPGAYQSQYSDQIQGVLNNILNRKEFSYDFNADPLYQQYKDQYTTQGKNAMLDTMANSAALTGGYGNSYGVTAGAQANQMYLQQLNNVIPELYNAALEKYDMDTNNLYNQFSALGTQEDRAYGQYRDTVSDWQADRGYYYDKYAGGISNDQYVADYNQTQEEYDREQQRWDSEFAYQKERDAVSDNQWNTQFEYQKQRDLVADDQWAKEYALSLANKNSGSSGSSSGSGSGNSGSGDKDDTGSANLSAIAQTAAQLKSNQSSGGGNYADYLADQVNKGNITEEQAQSIISDVNKGKVISRNKVYIN